MKVINCEQGSRDWSLARRGVATASNADRIITPAKGEFSTSAYNYACELLVAKLLPPHWWVEDDDFQSEAMAHGTNTEKEARAYFELESGLVVREVGFIQADDGRSGCSPDGVIGDGDSITELLELKCPQHKTQVRYLDKGELPPEYRPQVHWSLAVTDCSACNFMSYAQGLPPLILRIEPDGYTAKVRELMKKFFDLMDAIRARVEARREVTDIKSEAELKPEPKYSFPLTG